jgi:hypothetical protein
VLRLHVRSARDPGRLSASLEDFVGHPAYGISQLRMDLDRFTFLLGGNDGEHLFGASGPAHSASRAAHPAAACFRWASAMASSSAVSRQMGAGHVVGPVFGATKRPETGLLMA